eukprot:COSAG01_NODE_7337_length_3244_cov_3.393005_1_plen_77_part_00
MYRAGGAHCEQCPKEPPGWWFYVGLFVAAVLLIVAIKNISDMARHMTPATGPLLSVITCCQTIHVFRDTSGAQTYW